MRTVQFLLAFAFMAIPAVSPAQIGISISISPPALPAYEQPICPGDGYLWTPGYWAYDDSVSDYYWVDGTWVMAPEEGLLWTPGYWGWRDGGFFFNEGYWGQEVGFYGGINYGFGYGGEGYGGGRWDGGHFFYNRSANNVDITINRNVYSAALESHGDNRVSFNGGAGGIAVRATLQQEAVARQRHVAPVAAQIQHEQVAKGKPELRSAVNHGKPSASEPPIQLGYNDRQPAAARPVVHPNDLPAVARPAPVDSGNARADQKYQKQQDKLIAQQNQERNNLQQKQEAEHQAKATPAQAQQVEQKHAQQTQQLSQKHQAQQQSLQARQPQPRPRK
jgi:hypothetical protein